MKNHHFEERIRSRQEFAHDDLEQWLAFKIFLFVGELDVELADESLRLFFFGVLDGIKDFEDGVKDELIKSSLELLTFMRTRLDPLLGMGIKVVVSLVILLARFLPCTCGMSEIYP